MYYTSDSGATIITGFPFFSFSPNGIAYGNGTWVTVGNSGGPSNNIYYSQDSSNWYLASGDSFGGYGNKVAYANGKFIAVGNKGANVATIYSSTDGINWSSNATTATGELLSITYGPGVWITNDSTHVYISSDNGSTWGSVALDNSFNKIVYGDTTIAAANNGLFVSTDQGSSYLSISASYSNMKSIVYGNGVYVAVGMSNSSNVALRCSGYNTISYTLEPITNQANLVNG